MCAIRTVTLAYLWGNWVISGVAITYWPLENAGLAMQDLSVQ